MMLLPRVECLACWSCLLGAVEHLSDFVLRHGWAASRSFEGDFALTFSAAFPWGKCDVGLAFVHRLAFAFALALTFTFAFMRRFAVPFAFESSPET
jgi:hypothetical protein